MSCSYFNCFHTIKILHEELFSIINLIFKNRELILHWGPGNLGEFLNRPVAVISGIFLPGNEKCLSHTCGHKGRAWFGLISKKENL